jgi:tetratricopeptide (TPR) repeat protein
MLKRFIRSLTRATAGIILLALLNACVSLDDGRSSVMSSESVDPSGQNADDVVSSEITHDGVSAAMPVPEVSAENAEVFERAVAFIRAGQFEEAEVLLLEITFDQPELAGPWINLGQIYAARDQAEEARQSFEMAILANPWNCAAHNELGVLSRLQGDFDNAERHYLTCIDRVPNDKSAYLNLGILYELYLGKLSEALACYRHYQSFLNEPDRRVQGWVMDLERRLGV